MSKRLAAVVVVVVAAAVLAGAFPRALPAQTTRAAAPSVEDLLKKLGSDSWRAREEATTKLVAVGADALPALRRAMLSGDIEMATRARMIAAAIVGDLPPGEMMKTRENIAKAFALGDYNQAIDLARRLASNRDATAFDALWLGHACQMAGQWKEAVEAYLLVLAEPAADPAVIDITGENPGGRINGNNKKMETAPALTAAQRSSLATWIARIQTGEMKDPKGAVETLSKTAAYLKDEVGTGLLWDLAAAQGDAGDLAAALATWNRINAKAQGKQRAATTVVDVQRLDALVSAWPADKPLPEFPCLFVLTAKEPAVTLQLHEEATLARAYQPTNSPDQPFEHFAFTAEAGQELATLELACDLEQLNVHWGGQFECAVLSDDHPPTNVSLARLDWKKPAGREVIKVKAEVPPGRRVVHIVTGTSKDHFIMHSVEVKATFRPITQNPPPLVGGAWMQTELLPAGGTLMCGTKKLNSDTAYSDFPPGKYAVSYKVPGRADEFQSEITVCPGRRYSLFVNLDSPFRCTATELEGMNNCHIVALAGGGFLAVGERGQKIMLATSKDLVAWSAPAAAPFNSIFTNICPAAVATADGTVHVAFFSNRLTPQDSSSGGYRLLTTSTRDGKEWAPLRWIEIPHVGGSPIAPCLFQRADKTCVLLWNQFVATAKSFGEIQSLAEVTMEPGGPEGLVISNPQLAEDAAGGLHMVFSNFGRTIHHTVSKDALTWGAPGLLVEGDDKHELRTPQLILAGGTPLLMYGVQGSEYLAPVDLSGIPTPCAQGLKIANHVAPVAGGVFLTADGEVLLPVGDSQTSGWMLRAKLTDLQSAAAKAMLAATSRPAMGN